MLRSLFGARPAAAQYRTCKCCGTQAAWFGTVDFSRSCEDHRGKVMPDSGRDVDYFRCGACGFLFTDLIDGWSGDRVAAEIYNADYVRVDPDFAGKRVGGNADFLAWALEEERDRLRLLDYGGGEGLMAALLRTRGFAAESFDPFHAGGECPKGPFDLVTAFEVVAHSPDPHATFAEARALTAEDGAFLFTTLLQPPDIATVGLGWWYAAPRNGHVSLHSRESLRVAAQRAGWTLESFNDDLHAAWVRRPRWLRHLDRALAALRAEQGQALPARIAAAMPAASGTGDVAIATRDCRHGRMRFLTADRGPGLALATYGEHAEKELDLLGTLLREGDTVVEAGAHLGAHTVFLARAVGPRGHVIACEPQRRLYDLLRENLAMNGLDQVQARLEALGAERGSIRVPPVDYAAPLDFGAIRLGGPAGEAVGVETVDGLALRALRLLRVAAPGAQEAVLRGAHHALWQLRPILYVSNDEPAHSPPVVALIQSHGYRLWWHVTSRFNPGNFAGEHANVFGEARSIHLLCVPEEWEFAADNLSEVLRPGDAPPL